ncbi:uncharacterized protein LOC129618641 [Condylostylus longicornis]|uniref:uncharacterized protein LOC129618641 n=1 Tax=Condylostylus longicornis TaxID=2530218 RepID=UPI00244DD9C2|nr:uncharacterized protein LOC129618641 [Condylostylus longicornis]
MSSNRESDNNINYKSISCENIPELFLDKIVAKNHFSKYGKISKFILRPRRLQCTVDFEQEEDAKAALMNGGLFNGYEFSIKYTENGIPQVRNTEEWVDPDIQSELDAMGSVSQKQYRNVGFGSQSMYTGKTQQSILRLPKPILKNKSSVNSTQTTTNSFNNEIRTAESNLQNVPLKNELENIMQKQALNSTEKYNVLEARDKYIRLTMSKTIDLKNVSSMKGICPDMCPEKERYLRETRDQISSFEIEKDGSMNHKIAIKEYARSSADQESPLAHELRPEPTLKMTMTYLLHRIMDLCDDDNIGVGEWFHFVWDRTRSIRKDITQQELCSLDVVELIEQCARFHIHCAARLIAEDPSVFDQKINTENLTKCLQSLKYMYHDLRIKNITCPNEPEFRSYIVLLNLNDANFLWEVKQLPEQIRKSRQIREAINFYLAVENNNFVKFFKMIRNTSYMNSCLLLRYFNQVRSSAIRTIIKAYTSTRQNIIQIPLNYLTDILAFESVDDALIFFDHYKIECDYEKVTLTKSWNYIPDMPPQLDRCLEIVESKRSISVGESICGKPLGSTLIFENHEPHNSFDEYGYLKQNAWTAGDQSSNKKHLGDSKNTSSACDIVFKVPINSPPISPKQHQNQQIKSMFGLTQKKSQKIFPEDDNKISQSTKSSIFESNKLSPVSSAAPIFGAQNSTEFVDNTSSTFIFNTSTLKSNETKMFKSPEKMIDSPILPKSKETLPSIFGSKTTLKASTHEKQSHPLSALFEKTENDGSLINNFQTGQSKNQMNSHPKMFSAVFDTAKPFKLNNETFNKFSNMADYNENCNLTANNNIFQNQEYKQDNMAAINKRNRKRKSENDEYVCQVQTVFLEEEPPLSPVFQPEKLFKRVEQEERNDIKEIVTKEDDSKRNIILEEQKLKKEEEKRILAQKQAMIEKHSENILYHILGEVLESFVRSIIENVLLDLNKNKVVELTATKILEDICNEIINEYLEEEVSFELKHFSKNQMLLRKYFVKWRNSTVKSIERRNLIQKAQNWAMPENMETVANKLAHPTQKLNLEMIYRYRLGISKVFDLSYGDGVRKINVISTFTKELEKGSPVDKIYGRVKSRKYFKIVISIPNDTDEIKGFSSHVTSFLNKSIERSKPPDPKKGFLCEAHGNIAMCVQIIYGQPEFKTITKCDHLNGLIFFLTLENLSCSRKRLFNLFKNAKINASVPISLLVYKNLKNCTDYEIEDILALDELQKLEKISNFKTFKFDDYNIINALTEGIKYLAKNMNHQNDLEMQKFTSFLQATIGDEIWKRFYDSWLINPTFQLYCNKPENVIRLYNTAIDKLINLFKEDLSAYAELPRELVEFVPNIVADIPKEVEYFPNNWREDKRNIKFITFLQKLKLKEIKETWPTDIKELEIKILNYAKECLAISKPSIEMAGYSSIKALLEELNNPEVINIELEQRYKQLSWLEVIRPIALKLLSQVWKTLQNLVPIEVIYRKDKYHNFTKLPWWLTDLHLKQLKVDLGNDDWPKHEELNEKLLSFRETHSKNENIDDILDRGYQLIEKATQNIHKYQSYLNSTREISKDLDFSLHKIESEKLKSFPNLKDRTLKIEDFSKKFESHKNLEIDEVQTTIDKALSVIKKFETAMDSKRKFS